MTDDERDGLSGGGRVDSEYRNRYRLMVDQLTVLTELSRSMKREPEKRLAYLTLLLEAVDNPPSDGWWDFAAKSASMRTIKAHCKEELAKKQWVEERSVTQSSINGVESRLNNLANRGKLEPAYK